MKKLISAALLVMLLLTVTACSGGNKEMKAAAGTYNLTKSKLVGDSEWITGDEYRLELTADGKGKHFRSDLELNVEWSIQGEEFTMKETFMGMTLEYTGTLKNGELDIFNGDPEDIWTYEFVYNK